MPFLIISDHPVLRRALRRTLESHFPLVAARAAKTGADALLILHSHPVDVVILDLPVPRRRGVALLKLIKWVCPSVTCLALTRRDKPDEARCALAAGASGYLVKPASSDTIRDAVQTLLSERRAVRESHHERCDAGCARCGTPSRHEPLSSRGRKILSLLASGRPLPRVAKQLRLSVRTVHVYQSRILAKLGLKTPADVIQYTVNHQLARRQPGRSRPLL